LKDFREGSHKLLLYNFQTKLAAQTFSPVSAQIDVIALKIVEFLLNIFAKRFKLFLHLLTFVSQIEIKRPRFAG
jgi:hypothetical protein